MFAGFKGNPQLRYGNGGLNIYLPGGTGAAENPGTPLLGRGANNIIIGQGMNPVNATSNNNASNNNILIGCLDSTVPATIGSSQISIIGSNHVILLPTAINSTAGSNPSWNIGATVASSVVVIGAYGSSSAPGTGSVSIGSAASTGTNGISIGPGANSSGAGVAIGSGAITGGSNTSIGALNAGTGFGCLAVGMTGILGFAVNNGAYLQYLGAPLDTPTPPATVNAGVAVGVNANIDMSNSFNMAFGSFSTNPGSAQTSIVTARMQTTNATPVELGVAASGTNSELRSLTPTGFPILTNNSTYMVTGQIAARKSSTGTDYAGWSFSFLITREANAAATALVGTPAGLTAPLYATTGATTGSWAVAITADTTNGRFAVKVTGQSATTINWVGTYFITKVSN